MWHVNWVIDGCQHNPARWSRSDWYLSITYAFGLRWLSNIRAPIVTGSRIRRRQRNLAIVTKRLVIDTCMLSWFTAPRNVEVCIVWLAFDMYRSHEMIGWSSMADNHKNIDGTYAAILLLEEHPCVMSEWVLWPTFGMHKSQKMIDRLSMTTITKRLMSHTLPFYCSRNVLVFTVTDIHYLSMASCFRLGHVNTIWGWSRWDWLHICVLFSSQGTFGHSPWVISYTS